MVARASRTSRIVIMCPSRIHRGRPVRAQRRAPGAASPRGARPRPATLAAILRQTVPRVIPKLAGDAVATKAIRDQAAEFGRLAGLEDVSPHTLQHSFGKHLDIATSARAVLADLTKQQDLIERKLTSLPQGRDPRVAVSYSPEHVALM